MLRPFQIFARGILYPDKQGEAYALRQAIANGYKDIGKITEIIARMLRPYFHNNLPLNTQNFTLLNLLQLASPTLPVGAYSYSDGLETLVAGEIIDKKESLCSWMEQELRYGAIKLEAAVMIRAYRNVASSNLENLAYWNAWLSAAKETSELRAQSWQMGNSLLRLLLDLQQQPQMQEIASAVGYPCNYAIAFGIGAACWQIEAKAALLGYLHSWASNLIGAGVKLIPLGQTTGQQLLFALNTKINDATQEILALEDDDLSSCGWGLTLASMAHETQYTRLFRS